MMQAFSPFLQQAHTEKLNPEMKIFDDIKLEIGHSSMQGFRVTMEDEYIIDKMVSLPDHAIVAIMDGHAGTVAAKYTSMRLKEKIEESEPWQEYCNLPAEKRSEEYSIELVSSVVLILYCIILSYRCYNTKNIDK